MAYTEVILERQGEIAILYLNRPEKMNAMSALMKEDLAAALDEVKKDNSYRVLVFSGKGKGFCSGADVNRLDKGRSQNDSPKDVAEAADKRLKAFVELGKPVIAAINGVAIGAGLTMASWCDFRLAAKSARFGALFVKRGILADGGLSYILPKLIGHNMACQMMLTGDMIDSAEAFRMGLVNAVYPDESLMEEAIKFANKMVQNAPLAMRDIKAALYRSLESDLISQLDFEAERQMALFKTEDAAEGMKAFLEKRSPNFKWK